MCFYPLPFCFSQVRSQEDQSEKENQQSTVWWGFLFWGMCDFFDTDLFVIVKMCWLSVKAREIVRVHKCTTWPNICGQQQHLYAPITVYSLLILVPGCRDLLPSAIDVEPQGLAGSFKGVKWMSGLCEGQSKFLHSKLGKHFFKDLMALYSGTLFFWNAFPKRLTHSWKHIISKISRFLLIGWLHLQCFWTYFWSHSKILDLFCVFVKYFTHW